MNYNKEHAEAGARSLQEFFKQFGEPDQITQEFLLILLKELKNTNPKEIVRQPLNYMKEKNV